MYHLPVLRKRKNKQASPTKSASQVIGHRHVGICFYNPVQREEGAYHDPWRSLFFRSRTYGRISTRPAALKLQRFVAKTALTTHAQPPKYCIYSQ